MLDTYIKQCGHLKRKINAQAISENFKSMKMVILKHYY